MNSPACPEKKFMTRDDSSKASAEATNANIYFWASQRLFTCVYKAFPCVEIKRFLYVQTNLSNIPDHSKVSTSAEFSSKEKAIIFTMTDLSKATSRFSSSCKIGEGGVANVYKGTLRDGTIVAIKRAIKFEAQSTSQFQSEINTLANVEHPNLVRLIGYFEDKKEKMLVEEYVSNGNVRQHLDCDSKSVLGLYQRLNIAIDVGHALTYLHAYADQPIIHRDIKSSNILLTKSFRAKVADFGYSRIGPLESEGTHVLTQVKGTAGYVDPEYIKTYKLTVKSDVYAFGILLVELITGRRPIEQSRCIDERITVRWAYKNYVNGTVKDILDPRLERTDVACQLIESLFEVAFKCSAPNRQDRPTMKEVTESLWSIRKMYQTLSQNDQQQHK